jgi:hypothetical protein
LFTFREAGKHVSPVTMSHPSLRTAAPPCLPLDIKDSLKEDMRFLLLAFCFLGERRFLEGGITGKGLLKRKGLLKGKRLLKGKGLLRENVC